MKIPDVPLLPLLPSSDVAALPLETVLPTPTEMKLGPNNCPSFPVKEEQLPDLVASDDSHDEFGEFLMDAVQWL